ncbi:hypothetical protein BBJ28_00016861 [Nothophytophthora sp. Chile5]|nr:hypothetical protein BBJ28_00016861 [Nothophytophthora sp. Chile5]
MSDSDDAVSPAPVKTTRKKRYCFREGDDAQLLEAVLADRGVFADTTKRRMASWRSITAALNGQGVLASTHSLRCRLQRLVDVFRTEMAQGKRSKDLTDTEILLAEYSQQLTASEEAGDGDAGEQQLPKKAMPTPQPRQQQQEQEDSSRGRRLRSEADASTTPKSPADAPVSPVEAARRPPPPAVPMEASISATPTGRARKKRFSFRESHDVLLLKAMLADQGTVGSAGSKKPAWKHITASLNSQGVHADTHSLRTHLRIMVDTHRKEGESPLDVPGGRFSEKKLLLITYCRRLDEEEQEETEKSEEQAVMAASRSLEVRVTGKRANRMVAAAGSAQVEPPASVAESSNVPQTGQTSSTAAVVEPTPVEGTTEATEDMEPPTKKQRATLEVILERFVADQNERRKEELEHKRIVFSAQQDLQRQTIALQERVLEVQDKALEMQNKLMLFMEKMVDKLN